MKKIYEYSTVSALGAVIYSAIEILFRGYTHWTMFITGGITFLSLYLVNLKIKTRSILLRSLICCAIITCIEFLVGCLVNKVFRLDVWDYSHQKFNLLGQICPLFSMLWFFLSIPATFACFFIKSKFVKKR